VIVRTRLQLYVHFGNVHQLTFDDMPNQCGAASFCAMASILVVHFAKHTSLGKGTLPQAAGAAWVASMVVILAVGLKIDHLTTAHQLMGMMAFEAGARSINGPTVVVTKKSELIGLIAFVVLNFNVILGDTVMYFTHGWPLVGFRPSGYWWNMGFFRKQHDFLHAALCILMCSISTSFVKRWRHCSQKQRVRLFIEPACVVSVAMVLYGHVHNTHDHEHLGSHPVIANMMVLVALTQTGTSILHMLHPGQAGGDLALRGGSAPALQLCRLINAFVHMLLAYFLYIDTFMEYLGCRYEVLLIGEPGAGAREGLTLENEVDTYVASAVMLAALTLAKFTLSEPSLDGQKMTEQIIEDQRLKTDLD